MTVCLMLWSTAQGPSRISCSPPSSSPSTHWTSPPGVLRWYRNHWTCVWGEGAEYREIIKDGVHWCRCNHLHINTSKTKEMVISFRRKTLQITLMNIQGLDIEVVEGLRIPWFSLQQSTQLDWTGNAYALYKKGQSRLNLLKRLSSFGVCRTLLSTCCDTVIHFAIFYRVLCWAIGCMDRNRKKLKLIETSFIDNTSHPLHEPV